MRTAADNCCKKTIPIYGEVAVTREAFYSRADGRDRTGDLALTRGALFQLSYVGEP